MRSESEFNEALTQFIDALNVGRDPERFNHVVYLESVGKKWVKLCRDKSVYCFVAKQDQPDQGDIFKPESYKKPASRARGSIFRPEEYLAKKDGFRNGSWLYADWGKR